MKKMKWLLTSLVGLSLALSSCGAPKQSEEKSQEVKTEEVKSEEKKSDTQSEVEITRVAFGELADLSVDKGAAVKANSGLSVTGYYQDAGSEQSISLVAQVEVHQGDKVLKVSDNLDTKEVGTFTITYTVKTAGLVGFKFAEGLTLSKSRQLEVKDVAVSGEELVHNGDFAKGAEGWASYTDGSNVQISFDNGEMKAVETAISGNSYSPRVNTDYSAGTSYGFTLQYGVSYVLSIDLKADAARTVRMQLGTLLPADPWWSAIVPAEDSNAVGLTDKKQLIHDFQVGTTYETYTWKFTVAGETRTNTHITLEMGTINGDASISSVTTIYADNISVKAAVSSGEDELAPQIAGATAMKVGYVADSTDEIDVMAGVTVTDNEDQNPTVAHTIKNSEGAVVEKLTKGSPKGTYSVEIVATDAAGNESKATRTIVLKDLHNTPLNENLATVSAANFYGEWDAKDGTPVYGEFKYWYVQDAGWNCGPAVALTPTFADGKLTVNIANYNENTNFWCAQLFYDACAADEGTYEGKITIKSDVARKVKINGEDFDLEANTAREITFAVSPLVRDDVYDESLHLAIMLGTGDLYSGSSSNFEISNLSIVRKA